MNTLTSEDLSVLHREIKKQTDISFQSTKGILYPLMLDVNVPGEHQHLLPILERAVDLIVLAIKPIRFNNLARSCVGSVARELATPWELDQHNHPSNPVDGPGLAYDFEITDDLSVVDHGWIDPDEVLSSIDNQWYCVDDLRLSNAVEAANASPVFKACKVRLELDGLTLKAFSL